MYDQHANRVSYRNNAIRGPVACGGHAEHGTCEAVVRLRMPAVLLRQKSDSTSHAVQALSDLPDSAGGCTDLTGFAQHFLDLALVHLLRHNQLARVFFQ